MIKTATLSDLEALTPLFDQYRQFYGKRSDEAAARKFLHERLTRGDSEIFLKINEEGVAAGFVQLYPLFSSTRLSRFWLLNDLFVHADHRGQGHSKELILRARQLCSDTDACGMYLETEKTNDIGNQLYPAMGFEPMNEVTFYNWDTK